jgi:metal transporter CNNM
MRARSLRAPTLAAFALVIAAAVPRVSLARLARDNGATNAPPPPVAFFFRDARDASFADRHDERRGEPPRGSRTTAYALGAAALVLVAGTMAGLTVGLLGVDPIELELRKEAELPSRDREDAKKIWDVVASHHWLLCTLLLVNAAASEALPLCLNAIMPEYVVIVVSVTLVLVFGEILPSAVFTGPRRVRLASACVPFVRALMWLTAPLSWPMARALDRVVGEDHASTRLDRAQIGTLIGLHGRARSPARRPPRRPPRRARAPGVSVIEDADENARESSPLLENTDERRGRPRRLGNIFTRLVLSRVWFTSNKGKVSEPRAESRERAPGIVSASTRRAGVLSDDEVTIVRETLKLAHKTVYDAMTPLRDVYMLPWESTAFDEDTLAGVLGAGFSRVPVFRGGNRHNVVGTLMVKKLIVLDPNERRHVRDVPLRAPLLAHPDAGLLETLNAFQAGRSHMALVTKHASRLERAWRLNEDVAAGAVEILGIITVEDVLEELIGEEIQDEDDYAETLTRRDFTRGGAAEESASRAARAPARVEGVPSVRLAFDERRRRELRVADDATRDVSDCAPIRNPEDVSRRASRLQARGANEDAIVTVSPSKRVRFAEKSTRVVSRGREEPSELPPAVFAAARKFKLLLARRRARRLRRSDSLESRDEHASGAS